MNRAVTRRCWRWVPVLLLVLACVSIFREWLAPGNVAAWLSLLSFCS